jgi:hypothetical protein
MSGLFFVTLAGLMSESVWIDKRKGECMYVYMCVCVCMYERKHDT